MEFSKRYILNTSRKPRITEVNIQQYLVGRVHFAGNNVYAVWDLKTKECISNSKIPNLLIYEYKEVMCGELDWRVLPDNIMIIDGSKQGDIFGAHGSEKGLEYDKKTGGNFDRVGQTRISLLNDYNINIMDLPAGERIYRPEDQLVEFNPEKEDRENGNILCHCGSNKTKPYYFNGIYFGFKCRSCSSEMLGESLSF